jgi:cell division protein FtsZ
MLVQEAAHEEANIIFGAVIDDEVPEGELRVTVIATGLNDNRARRAATERRPPTVQVDRQGAEQLEIQSVAPIEPQASPFEPINGVEQAGSSAAQQEGPAQQEVVSGNAEDIARPSPEFASPFEDEFDTPAFIRRRNNEDEDQDREVPAFLRRAQD